MKDNQIVLNISPDAVVDLSISNQAVAFNGRFGGVATDVFVPIAAVVGVYARKMSRGMVFDPGTLSAHRTTRPRNRANRRKGRH
ncbi:MAG: ClpXP protease specificity-enhancing factor SspB [Halioglobus sp.]